MLILDAWEQTAVFNPSDPTQKKIEKYAGVPGAYASFYFNRVAPGGTLKGLGGSSPVTWRGLVVTGLLAWGGLWAARRYGVDTKVRTALRKVPGVRRLPGIAGLRGRRR